jgi:hypothetical protein
MKQLVDLFSLPKHVSETNTMTRVAWPSFPISLEMPMAILELSSFKQSQVLHPEAPWRCPAPIWLNFSTYIQIYKCTYQPMKEVDGTSRIVPCRWGARPSRTTKCACPSTLQCIMLFVVGVCPMHTQAPATSIAQQIQARLILRTFQKKQFGPYIANKTECPNSID